MKNLIIVILLGISVFLGISLLYMHKKSIAAEIEGMGNLSYTRAREKAAAEADKHANTEIKIALMGNWNNDSFKELQKGVKLACAEINKQGGLNGRKVKIVVKDSMGMLSTAKIVTQELAADTSITALICGFNYMELMSISSICEYNGLLLMSPVVSSGILQDQAALPMVFTNYPDIDTTLKVMYQFLKVNNLKSTAIISPPQYFYGYYFANAFDSQLSCNQMNNATVVRRDICYESAPHLLNKTFRVWDPKMAFDNMLICGGPAIVKNVMPLARELNPQAVYMLTDEMEIKELTEAKNNNLKIFLPSVYDQSSEKKANKLFCSHFNATFGYLPGVWAAQGYDTLNVIAAAIKKAESTVPIKLVDSLYHIKYTENVSTAPYIAFDRDGLLLGAEPVMIYPKNGGFKVLKSLNLKDVEPQAGK